MKDPVRIFLWSIKQSDEILDKLKVRDFNAISLSTYSRKTKKRIH